MLANRPSRHRPIESAGVPGRVKAKPAPRAPMAALTRPAPSRLLALADAVVDASSAWAPTERPRIP